MKEDIKYETVLVEDFVFEKVKKNDVKINIPQSPLFYQAFNYRIVIGLFPQLNMDDVNKVDSIKIIRIDSEGITQSYIYAEASSLSMLLMKFKSDNSKTADDRLRATVVDYLMHYYGADTISQEKFLEKYNEKLNNLSEIINCKWNRILKK